MNDLVFEKQVVTLFNKKFLNHQSGEIYNNNGFIEIVSKETKTTIIRLLLSLVSYGSTGCFLLSRVEFSEGKSIP